MLRFNKLFWIYVVMQLIVHANLMKVQCIKAGRAVFHTSQAPVAECDN